MIGEAGSAPHLDAEKFRMEFREIIDGDISGFHQDAIFNAHEDGLFWKKMPSRTYITKKMNHVPGRKVMKDRITVLLCANASGRRRMKPMLIHKSAQPRCFKSKIFSLSLSLSSTSL
jgi:hypothetical protein